MANFQEIQIHGCVSNIDNTPIDDEKFFEEFITWVESQGYRFGGGTAGYDEHKLQFAVAQYNNFDGELTLDFVEASDPLEAIKTYYREGSKAASNANNDEERIEEQLNVEEFLNVLEDYDNAISIFVDMDYPIIVKEIV